MRVTIHVDSHTVYAGQISSLASLTPSMTANMQYKMLRSGGFLATHILVRPAWSVVQTVNGKVSTINGSTFTLMGNNGKLYTFQITSKSTFSGLGVSHLRELESGMAVRVTFRGLGNGQDDVLKVLVRRD